jgi:uncharacterized protein involved in response to NO
MATREIPVQPAKAGPQGAAPAAHAPAVPQGWRFSRLATAPHRLGFFCAVTILVLASLWWLLVQWDRSAGIFGLRFALSSTIVHGTIMVFGFMPLFFSGFLFTAGPKWLNVPAYSARQLLLPLLLQLAGWILWLIGAFAGRGLAIAALFVAWLGLAGMFGMFWRLIALSKAQDRMHALSIGCGGLVGLVGLGGAALSLLAGQDGPELVFVQSALWGFIVVTFSTVAHRMIPYFTHNVVPSVELWRPHWILGLMLGVAAFEVLANWVAFFAPAPNAWPAWIWLCVVVETVIGALLLWVALVWGVMQSMRNHLLGMLHIGFSWFGFALLYSALGRVLWITTGSAVLGVGALHALSMGFLGSLILAMVTRVTCGHSGRPLVADALSWGLFLLLQVTVLVRLLAAIQGVPIGWTLATALLWAVVVTVWGLRFAGWYGRPRADGKPG